MLFLNNVKSIQYTHILSDVSTSDGTLTALLSDPDRQILTPDLQNFKGDFRLKWD